MQEKPLSFVIPTYRLREVGETVASYDAHFWRNGHAQRAVLRGAEAKGTVSIELWPTLIEICYFQKGRKGLPQVRVNNPRR